MRIQPFESSFLPQLLELVNLHLAAVVPGWALSGAFLAEHLDRDRTEPLTDPWVEERATLCAVDGGGRLLAAAHLLRYGEGREVAGGYRGAGEIDWLVALPGRGDAATGILAAARDHLASWRVRKEYGWISGLPTVPMIGVPESWPHVAATLEAAGGRPDGSPNGWPSRDEVLRRGGRRGGRFLRGRPGSDLRRAPAGARGMGRASRDTGTR